MSRSPLPTPAVRPPAPPAVDRPWARPAAEVVAAVASDPDRGLAEVEAARRRAADGPNALPSVPPRPAWRRFVAQLRSVLIVVLLVAAGLAVAVGEPVDAAIILAVILLNATMGFLQERRAERAVDALEQLLTSTARVVRDGRAVEVDASELVVGDLVEVQAGDRLPADGRWVQAVDLRTVESSLTGESRPVEKGVDVEVAADAPVADRATMGWTNTTVATGRGRLVVTATGAATQVGRVATLLAEATPRPTPLQRQLDTLGHRLAAVAGVAVVAVLALALARGETPGEAALAAMALAVAAIPEGLPAVTTLTLALGASVMARRRAVVRRLTSVESLGATDVICTDKTGTLTRNRMTVTSVWRAGREHAPETGLEPTGRADRWLGALVRCNDAVVDDEREVGDPTETALLHLARDLGADLDALRTPPRVAELPFDARAKLMAVAHLDVDGRTLVVEVKGAPDVVLPRCRRWVAPDGDTPLDTAARGAVDTAVREMAGRGLRTLAVATRRVAGADAARPLPELLDELTLEAVVGITDPPRPGVADSVAQAQRAGIRVVMITGDHPATAAAIAAQLGIAGEVVTGPELDAWDDATLAARVETLGVCARVAPEHKVRLVAALQAHGRVVAMTGDGVNDAPALEHADVGVAMGIAGTEVTKRAADVVLADDDFTTIVRAVEHGRTIYDNIVAFVRFQLATNLGAIAVVLGTGLLGLAMPFTAVQLLWVNVIMDGPPALALGVDRARQDTMSRPPRGRVPLLGRERFARVALAAAVMAAGTLGLYGWALAAGVPGPQARTWAFTTFVLFQVGNALNVRSEHTTLFARQTLTNRWLWLALAGVVGLQVLAVQVAAVAGVLDTVALTWRQWVGAVAVAATVVVVEEARKGIGRRRAHRGATRRRGGLGTAGRDVAVRR